MATNDPGTGAGADAAKVSEVLQTETGGRALQGPAAVLLFIIPVCWSLFQLWIASPLPFILNFGIFNSTEARSIHLAFAVFLAFSAFPMIKGVHANKVPIYDWVLALAAAFAASYLYVSTTSWLPGRAHRLPRICGWQWLAWCCYLRQPGGRLACR